MSSEHADTAAIQQMLFNSEIMPNGIAPGEVMYVMVGDVAYEIVGPANPGDKPTINPMNPAISLEDLASISADQEAIKADYSYQMPEGEQATGGDSALLQTEDQQYYQQDQSIILNNGGVVLTNGMPEGDNGMQMMIMGEGDEGSTMISAKTSGVDAPTTIKLGGQDFVLQPGQQLPPEIQELVAKGLPVDLSNYEFVIEGDPGTQSQDGTDNYIFTNQQESDSNVQQQSVELADPTYPVRRLGSGNVVPANSVIYSKYAIGTSGNVLISPQSNIVNNRKFSGNVINNDNIKYAGGMVNSDINSLKYGGNVMELEQQSKSGIYIQVITASPGEFDDGEFTYLTPELPTNGEQANMPNEEPRLLPNTGFMNSYMSFVKNGMSIVGGNQTGEKFGSLGQKNRIVDSQNGSLTPGRSLLLNNQNQNKSVKRRRAEESDNEFDGGKVSKTDDSDDPTWKISSNKIEEPRFSSGRGRGNRGRGRGATNNVSSSSQTTNSNSIIPKPIINLDASRLGMVGVEPAMEFPVNYIMQNEPHNYFKGDFVIDRKDLYKVNDFPIWRIENGKLLQKFDPMVEDGKLFHKSASVYSSWSGDIKQNFKSLMVETITTNSLLIGRKQEVIVQVVDKYLPKPPDEALEQNALMQFFNIYVHVLLNQVFESAYLSAIHQQNVEYYLEPMTQIDQLIMEAKQAILSEFTWNFNFKIAMETWSCYTFVSIKQADHALICQATSDCSVAVKTVRFYGQSYDISNLTVSQELPLHNSKDIPIGKATFENLGIYHALHHFKYLLFKKCQEEANFVSLATKAQSEIPDICIQNRIWVQQLFTDLKGLLDRYIIIKTEEEPQMDITNNHDASNPD